MNAPNLDTAETAWAEGMWLNGRYLPNGETAQCRRCGIWRRVRPDRDSSLCLDCKTVEHHTAKAKPEPLADHIPVKRPGGIVRFDPLPEPLSAEDRAWCERQVERHFWQQWERANRAGTTTERTIQTAIRKVA